MCNCHSILECCVMFSGVKLSIRSFNLFIDKFPISNHIALKLDVHAPGSYLRLICEYELYILPNKKVSAAEDHGKNYMKDRHPLSTIFCTMVYSVIVKTHRGTNTLPV